MTSHRALAPLNRQCDCPSSGACRDALAPGEPRSDHVRALLHFDGSEPCWISYERLLTYGLIDDGKPAVVCLVNRTQNISIPLAGGP